jgi:hypothetical protein
MRNMRSLYGKDSTAKWILFFLTDEVAFVDLYLGPFLPWIEAPYLLKSPKEVVSIAPL